ncbi:MULTISPECIES: phage holin family protein [Sphingomonas]|uniref:phage holin family protein n=1 Tax=Sphingomonas TaxID=13687 RepID=UPI0013B39204|nr:MULTISPECIES: phage holin family protein [Sphingomonas]
MLKPAGTPSSGDDNIGELVHRLVDDGKAYAKAELAYVKTLGTEKASELKQPLVFGVLALFFAHAAFLALCALLWVGLAQVMNAALAGLVTLVVLGGLAGLFAALAKARIKGKAGR